MSNEDPYLQAAHERAGQIKAELASAKADLETNLNYNHDRGAAAANVQQIANLVAEQRNLNELYAAHVQSQQPAQDYASEESRAARGPTELDAYDMGKICGISPQEYSRQYAKLDQYKRLRGLESK